MIWKKFRPLGPGALPLPALVVLNTQSCSPWLLLIFWGLFPKGCQGGGGRCPLYYHLLIRAWKISWHSVERIPRLVWSLSSEALRGVCVCKSAPPPKGLNWAARQSQSLW